MPPVKSFGERIADALIEDGLLTTRQVEELMEQQKREGTRFIKLVLEKAYVIQIPEPYKRTIWQPWIMNYSGERGIDVNINEGWTRYAWVDQALKEKSQ